MTCLPMISDIPTKRLNCVRKPRMYNIVFSVSRKKVFGRIRKRSLIHKLFTSMFWFLLFCQWRKKRRRKSGAARRWFFCKELRENLGRGGTCWTFRANDRENNQAVLHRDWLKPWQLPRRARRNSAKAAGGRVGSDLLRKVAGVGWSSPAVSWPPFAPEE